MAILEQDGCHAVASRCTSNKVAGVGVEQETFLRGKAESCTTWLRSNIYPNCKQRRSSLFELAQALGLVRFASAAHLREVRTLLFRTLPGTVPVPMKKIRNGP